MTGGLPYGVTSESHYGVPSGPHYDVPSGPHESATRGPHSVDLLLDFLTVSVRQCTMEGLHTDHLSHTLFFEGPTGRYTIFNL